MLRPSVSPTAHCLASLHYLYLQHCSCPGLCRGTPPTHHTSSSLWWHVMVWSSEALINQQDIWIFLETFEAEAEVWVNKRLLWYGWILSLFQKYVLARAGSADSTCHLQYIENILDTISRPAQMYSLRYTLYRHPQSSQHSGVDIAYWCLS